MTRFWRMGKSWVICWRPTHRMTWSLRPSLISISSPKSRAPPQQYTVLNSGRRFYVVRRYTMRPSWKICFLIDSSRLSVTACETIRRRVKGRLYKHQDSMLTLLAGCSCRPRTIARDSLIPISRTGAGPASYSLCSMVEYSQEGGRRNRSVEQHRRNTGHVSKHLTFSLHWK